jgi:hypothetical protein
MLEEGGCTAATAAASTTANPSPDHHPDRRQTGDYCRPVCRLELYRHERHICDD